MPEAFLEGKLPYKVTFLPLQFDKDSEVALSHEPNY